MVKQLKYLFSITAILLSMQLNAQSKEQQQLFRKFSDISNAGKILPLQLLVETRNESNLPMAESDTVNMNGRFFIQQDGAYIEFGNIEQIVTDSLVLVVLKDIRQMVLSKNTTGIAPLLKNMLRMPTADSSISKFAKRYDISQKRSTGKNGTMQLISVQKIPGTETPAEEVEMTYDVAGNFPTIVKTTKRTLLKKPQEEYPAFKGRIVSIADKGDYFLKEDISVYEYTRLAHDANIQLPVKISDRIAKDAEGNYQPVKNYQAYTLVQH